MKSSGRDHEMVNQRGLWIESSIVSSRAHLAANNADLFRYKSEFISYFNWVSFQVLRRSIIIIVIPSPV